MHKISLINRSNDTGYCSICGNVKLFWNDHKGHYTCANAKRKDTFLSHNLNEKQYKALLKANENSCHLCGEEFESTPHIDHDHSCCPGPRSCGKCVRGILCAGCNISLGHMEKMLKLDCSHSLGGVNAEVYSKRRISFG